MLESALMSHSNFDTVPLRQCVLLDDLLNQGLSLCAYVTL